MDYLLQDRLLKDVILGSTEWFATQPNLVKGEPLDPIFAIHWHSTVPREES